MSIYIFKFLFYDSIANIFIFGICKLHIPCTLIVVSCYIKYVISGSVPCLGYLIYRHKYQHEITSYISFLRNWDKSTKYIASLQALKWFLVCLFLLERERSREREEVFAMFHVVIYWMLILKPQDYISKVSFTVMKNKSSVCLILMSPVYSVWSQTNIRLN